MPGTADSPWMSLEAPAGRYPTPHPTELAQSTPQVVRTQQGLPLACQLGVLLLCSEPVCRTGRPLWETGAGGSPRPGPLPPLRTEAEHTAPPTRAKLNAKMLVE